MGYLSDIAFTIESPDNKSTLSYSDYQVFASRNEQWVKRLRPYLKEGKAFITLNCIYLGGDKGLIQQLRKQKKTQSLSAGHKKAPYSFLLEKTPIDRI